MNNHTDLDHLLRASFDGRSLDGFTTDLVDMAVFRYPEERYFKIHLISKDLHRSRRPVVRGIFFSGRGRLIRPWLEIAYVPNVMYVSREGEEKAVDISGTQVEVSLFGLLASILPPGGRMMVEYGLKEHPRTAKLLGAGVPPVLTELGHLLFKSGFTSFKDWYFAEGWSEGNTKLQGEKALSEKARKEQLKKLALEMKKFIDRGGELPDLTLDAKEVYEQVLEAATSF